MIDEAQLKNLYRRMTAQAASALDANELTQALERQGWPDREEMPLDHIAASAPHADILRTALQLQPDAVRLSRALGERRPAQRLRWPTSPRWLALAAGLGVAAVLIVGLRGGTEPASSWPAMGTESETILSASFESPAVDRGEIAEAEAIFRGDFDS